MLPWSPPPSTALMREASAASGTPCSRPHSGTRPSPALLRWAGALFSLTTSSCLEVCCIAVHAKLARGTCPCPAQARNRSHETVLAAGRSRWGKLCMSCRLACADLAAWLLLCMMAIREKLSTWQVY